MSLLLFWPAFLFAQELPSPAPSPNEAFFGSRIQRTMTLLATSDKLRHNPVKILFYGQSITAQAWWKTVVEDLEKRYPLAEILAENRSIGGFTAPALVKPAVHDLYPFYPDLVVFSVYGGETTGDLERIISNIRRYTTAEIMIRTPHVAWPKDKPEAEVASRQEGDDIDADFLRLMAQKYNCELVEVRDEWKQYLKDNKLEAKDFLGDSIHLNDKGLKVMAALVSRHFQFNPLMPGGWTDVVRSYEVKRALVEGANDEIVFMGTPWQKSGSADAKGSSSDGILRLNFVGNRVDVIAGKSHNYKLGVAKIRIDGKPPSEHPGVHAITRSSKALGVWWPAVSRIGHVRPLVAENWTLRITKTNEEATDFSFEVEGSVTGKDGAGDNKALFVSNSGRVMIEPDSWNVAWGRKASGKPVPVGFEVTWSVVPMFVDEYTAPKVEDESRVYRTTLAQGLENGPHTLEIIPESDGVVPLREIVVHRPPLH
jgi:hypothetical protein